MVLKLYTYTYFFASSVFKYYAVEDSDNTDIEKIYYFDEELDLEDPESYDVALKLIDSLGIDKKDIKEDERKSWASHAAENFALVDDAIIFVVENCTIKSECALNYNEVAWVDILKCCS